MREKTRATPRYVVPLNLSHELDLTFLQRQRRDRSRERTPAREATPRKKTPPPKEPSRDIRSGSEEGEIEEEE